MGQGLGLIYVKIMNQGQSSDCSCRFCPGKLYVWLDPLHNLPHFVKGKVESRDETDIQRSKSLIRGKGQLTFMHGYL